MQNFQDILRDAAQMGAVKALESVGLTTGEISQRQAYETYGRKFICEMVETGRLQPSHIGTGRTGTIRYSIADILACRAADKIQAAIL